MLKQVLNKLLSEKHPETYVRSESVIFEFLLLSYETANKILKEDS